MLTKLSTADGANNAYSIPLTSFNDLRVANLTPMVGWTFNYNINSDYILTSTSNGGSATQANSMGVLSTSTASNGTAKITTRKAMRYCPGIGGLVRFTALFSKGAANSEQIIGLGDDVDGFFFGYNGTQFSILRMQNGTSNWTAQSAWNVDKMDGNGPSGIMLNTQYGNVYTIQYQWLGFGVINFYITSSTTGQPVLVHRINYPNTAAVPSIYNPCLPLMASVANNGNSTNLVLKTAAAMAFCEGDGNSLAIITRNSVSNSVSLTAPTDQNVITLFNNQTFAGRTNRTRIRLDLISTSSDGAKAVTFKLLRNAAITGTLSYTPINTSTSVIQYALATTTANAGMQIITFETAINSSTQLLLSSMNIFLAPGDTLTLQATSSNNNQLDCSLSWEELW